MFLIMKSDGLKILRFTSKFQVSTHSTSQIERLVSVKGILSEGDIYTVECTTTILRYQNRVRLL